MEKQTGLLMKSVHRFFCRAIITGWLIGLGTTNHGQIYNFENDFSQTVNTDTSVWSYRWKDGFSRDGNYLLFPYFTSKPRAGMPYFPIWVRAEETYPWVGVNDSGTNIWDRFIDPFCEWPWPNGQSNLHPAEHASAGIDALVVVTWFSPVNGLVNIKMRVTDLDGRGSPRSDGVVYYVDNGSAAGNIASGYVPNGGDTGFFWVTDVPVVVGDRLNFIIGPGINAYNDSTRLFVEITVVPEPTAFALLILAGFISLFRPKIRFGRN